MAERRWWLCGADNWPICHLFEAPNARSALAKYRQAIIDAERFNGRSRRDATSIVQAARLKVVAGPLSTEEARQYEFGWALAQAICDKGRSRDMPESPATETDAERWLSRSEIEFIRRSVDRIFEEAKP